MERRHFLAGLAGMALLPLAGCGLQGSLRVGIHTWIGYETLYLAQNLRWLPAGVALVSGTSATDSLTGLRNGELDAACLTLDEVLLARSLGVPLQIALVFNVSAGADMLVARADIHSLQQLEGKRLGVESTALGALMLNRVLDQAGLSRSAVQTVELPPAGQLAAWQQQKVDAIITYEPTASRLQELGGINLFNSRELPDTIFDVLAVRADSLWFKPVEGLIAAHFQALEHVRSNRQDALYRIAARQQISVPQVKQALAGVMLPGLAANHRYLDHADSRLAQAGRQLHNIMLDQGLLTQPDQQGSLLSPRWLPEVLT
ncbi:ABC transporter substrate-binding protein [Oceanimonas sp. CAM02]|uniref:ABC transporter substrate-binding protein n=1 Tax=Oceanimonas sp. CAM02 TaxID=3080336 RepID=UPI002935EFD9|nr:ABC transporter substrate-binding protein [Oceanimonas sp. CAM02]MDV2856971.1 ABC transporter substrate-binding protein [Oceanimonas sp. CAM02]